MDVRDPAFGRLRAQKPGTSQMLRLKWLFFPSLDLHTRSRFRMLPQFFRGGDLDTLDAGCGNGALSWAAYRKGNRVLGVTMEPAQIASDREIYASVGADSSRLEFQELNLRDVLSLDRTFDQIICSETLEHIKDDKKAVEDFFQLLRPGGVLHVCAPNALHPEHLQGRNPETEPEDGRHVRDGYTLETYRALLEPAGFQIVASAGIGAAPICWADRLLRPIRGRFGMGSKGEAAAAPVFLLLSPVQLLDRLNPPVPFSIYVQAVKPAE